MLWNNQLIRVIVLSSIMPPVLCMAGSDSFAQASTRCLFNEEEQICIVHVKGDVMQINRSDSIISIEPRGHCRENNSDGVKKRHCNVRIGLPDDFVYGLIVRSSKDGTTITSPTLRIQLPDLNL